MSGRIGRIFGVSALVSVLLKQVKEVPQHGDDEGEGPSGRDMHALRRS
jgi:hypothetical protein